MKTPKPDVPSLLALYETPFFRVFELEHDAVEWVAIERTRLSLAGIREFVTVVMLRRTIKAAGLAIPVVVVIRSLKRDV